MTERVEEIALVFIAIKSTQQAAFAVDVGAAHIVTGGDIIGT